MTPTTVGLDLAKNVFHVHVADASGNTIDSKRLTRHELMPFFGALSPCLIGIEACATAHNWARQLQGLGHDVRYPKARSRVDGPWIEALLERRRPMGVAVAVANKLARAIWAMLTTGEVFRTAQPQIQN